jgi:hypothetical protein
VNVPSASVPSPFTLFWFWGTRWLIIDLLRFVRHPDQRQWKIGKEDVRAGTTCRFAISHSCRGNIMSTQVSAISSIPHSAYATCRNACTDSISTSRVCRPSSITHQSLVLWYYGTYHYHWHTGAGTDWHHPCCRRCAV